ncbi:Uncharacterized protein DBV15_11475, partial [Temnothorax longispinosus]
PGIRNCFSTITRLVHAHSRLASGKSTYDKRNNTRITPGGVSGATLCSRAGVASLRARRTSTLNTEQKEVEIAATAAAAFASIQDTKGLSSFEWVSATADKQFPKADTRGKSGEKPLRGITPPALTRSGSEAYLAESAFRRIAAGFMYQEDGGSGGRLKRLPRPRSNPNRGLEAAVVAAAGWVERLNSGMTSRRGVISHALVANGIVMRVYSPSVDTN